MEGTFHRIALGEGRGGGGGGGKRRFLQHVWAVNLLVCGFASDDLYRLEQALIDVIV